MKQDNSTTVPESYRYGHSSIGYRNESCYQTGEVVGIKYYDVIPADGK